jgi:hypothetical protein
MVSDTCAAAGPELTRRRADPHLTDLLVCWRRPILAAVALLAIASAVALLAVREPATSHENAVAKALGVPSALAEWTRAGARPTPGELLEIEEAE